MTSFSGFRLAFCILALGFTGTAYAQENLDLNKSPAQLYASDCAICHKSPNAIAKSGGIFGMEGFLRQHYTASRESAAAIANYLKGFGEAPAGPAKKAATKKSSKGDDKKGAEKKSDGAVTLPGDNKPVEAKPAEAKPAESKPAEAKPEPKAEPAASPKAD